MRRPDVPACFGEIGRRLSEDVVVHEAALVVAAELARVGHLYDVPEPAEQS